MRWLRTTITAVALLLAAVHLIWPMLTIDAITVVLLAIALIPWLAPLFKSLELPGGFKVEFRDLQRAGQKAETVGLLEPEAPVVDGTPHAFEMVVDEDPNLALAGLRIEIEKRLKRLAEAREVPVRRGGVGSLLRSLDRAGVLEAAERSVLMDIIGTLNEAVHGAEVDSRAAEWALEIGPRLLASLEERVEGSGDGN